MTTEPKELGTLIIVVGKARNLPNLARFGKQDPFCSITVGNEKKKTKPIKRGGQHPEWDEEMRFSIMQDMDDILAASAAEAAANSLRRKNDGLPPLPNEQGVVTPATMASKSRVTKTGKKTGKTMKIACYADDPKEPELIGEAIVSIEEVLKKGEIDEWYEIQSKDKYCGEVYLECTFFSNAAPPVKRDVARPAVYNPNAPIRPQTQSSATGMNLYIPPYGQPARVPSPGVNAAGAAPGRPPPVQPGAHGAVAAAAAAGRLTHSSSFSELGLPPPPQQQHSAPVPGQPEYPPGRPPMQAHGSVDALTRPMMSMSLGPSYRPNGHPEPAAAQMPPQQHGSLHGHGHGHRLSLDNNGGAPWQQQHQQQQQQVVPPQRPVSAADMSYGGMHNDPRVNGGQPVSPAMPPSHHHRTSSTSLAVPPPMQQQPQQQGGYSPSNNYGVPPRPTTAEPQSYPQSAPYPPSGQQQQPQPPYTPENRRHSSYGPNYLATPPKPTPPQPSYSQPPPQSYTPAPQAPSPYGQPPAPPAQEGYPPVPPPPQKQPSVNYGGVSPYDPHRQRTDSFGSAAGVPGGYPQQQQQQPYPPTQTPAPQQPYPPAPQTPVPAPPPSATPPSTSTGTYVPWYMQTQQNQNTSTPPPPSNSAYSAPPPPPPAPPARVGYYPSDELYAMQANQQNQSHTPAPQAPYPPPNSQPSPPHNNNGYNAAPPTQPYPPQQQPYPPPAPPAQNPPPAPYPPVNNTSYTSTPPAPPRPSSDAPWSHLQQQTYTSSPQTQSQTLYYAQQGSDFRPGTVANDWGTGSGAPPVPAPLPPSSGGTVSNRDWRSYLSSLSSTNQTESPPPPLAARVASPNPPPRLPTTNTGYTPPIPPPPTGQQDWYNTPPPAVPSSIIPDYRPQPPAQPQWR